MESENSNLKRHFSDVLWDFWCIVSVIGIWPRFIEPNLLGATQLKLKIKNLPLPLKGLKILQFSDIHLNPGIPQFFIDKLISRIKSYNPDIIVFTGDFLCCSQMPDKERLKTLFCSLAAPYGCYAIFGNHDYKQTVSINENGEYDVITNESTMLGKAFSRLFSNIHLAKKVTDKAKAVENHEGLAELLAQTPFKILDNETQIIPIRGSNLNISGLGEYTLGKCLPAKAFANYDSQYPGIVLAHNPDSLPLLKDFPGDVVLCGHTHGGQINLPWIWKKFTLLEDMRFKKGLFRIKEKWVYITRGVGGMMQFRWFARPEIVKIQLEGAHE